jgi:mono/diheme cytochrome c family protein
MAARFRTAVSTLVLLGSALCAHAQDATVADQALVERGAYLSRAADCAACHTDPKGGQAYAGGYAIQSPLGTIYSTNITPSKRGGIGSWSEQAFAKAVREGVAADGTHLYPAMPYDAYSGISDADIKALYAYFQHGVAPVDTPEAKTTQLGFPYSQRWLMAGWNLLFLDNKRFASGDAPVPDAQRGKYLVDALGHCSSCHTPRNVFMANDSSAYLSGADVAGWHAPNLSADPVSGIGGWSQAELVQFFKEGHVPGKAVAAGGMAEAVEHSLRHLSDADLNAMAANLKSVPAKATAGQTQAAYGYGTPVTTAYDFTDAQATASLDQAATGRAAGPAMDAAHQTSAVVTDGAQLYEAACASCHQPSGAGTGDTYYPALFHNTTTGAARPNNLVMTILDGVKRHGASTAASMPAFRDDMDDAQVAAVSQFVATRFGNADLKISAATVAELRAGGPAPALQTLMPWLITAAVVVLLLLAWLLVGRRRKRA